MIQRVRQPINGDAAPGAAALARATPGAAARGLTVTTSIVAALGIVAAICRVGFGIEHGPINVIALIDLQSESSLPAWYSSMLLATAAALLGLVGVVKAARRQRFAWHWVVLAFIFALLSADETIQFHERAAWPVERILKLKGPFLYGWVIPALVFVGAVGIVYLKFLLHLPARTRWRFVLAGAVYVGAALGLEMVEGVWDTSHGKENGVYIAMVATEEILEMVGIVIFIHALLAYARDQWGAVTLQLAPVRHVVEPHFDIREITPDRPGSAPPGRAGAAAAARPDPVGV
jgi:hypothetical protein